MQTYILDMDGTLVNSMPTWYQLPLLFMESHRLPWPDGVKSLVGTMSCGKMIGLLYEKNAIPFPKEQVWDDLTEHMKGRYVSGAIREKPGAKDFLQRLKQKGIPCCVATATYPSATKASLDYQGMTPYLNAVFTTKEMGIGKNDPAFFLAVAEKMKAKPEECTVVEDALYAMKGAKAAGMRVVAIRDACCEGNRAEILTICDQYIEDYSQIGI